MGSRRQSYVKYKGLGIQRTTSKETSGLICWFIYYQQGSVYQYSQITAANFDKDPSSSKCQPSSTIQGSSGKQRKEKVKPIEVKGVEE